MTILRRAVFLLGVLLLAGCGGDGDDGPIVGGGGGDGSGDTRYTQYYLNISLPDQVAASVAGVRTARALAPSVVTRAAVTVPNLTRSNFDAVVWVPDTNAPDGYREVRTGIAHFESYGDGVYRVDIDGVPQVNGVIYVTVGHFRLVFLTLTPGTRAEPVNVNSITSIANEYLLQSLIQLGALGDATPASATERLNDMIRYLESLGSAEGDDFYRESLHLACPVTNPALSEACDPAYRFGVSVRVSGLSGSLTLRLNQAETRTVQQDGTFSFGTRFTEQDGFSVEIVDAPENAHCVLLNASGHFAEESGHVGVKCEVNTSTVALGSAHSCALRNGGVWCWGNNLDGQLGDGHNQTSGVPLQVSGITTAVDVAAGAYHSCAVLANGEIWCWGYGEGGNGLPLQVSGITNAVALASGYDHDCAVLATGEVRCWGSNGYGQLGDGSDSYADVPVAVVGITDAVGVAAGGMHSCAVLATGDVWCWGYNGYGQLGNGSDSDSSVPVRVNDLSNAVSIAAGSDHSCAVVTTGEVWCWGGNEIGQLGNGGDSSTSAPVQVSGVVNAVSVAAAGYRSCAVSITGEAWCWGYTGWDEWGEGSTSEYTAIPVQVSGIANVMEMGTGGGHSCAVLASGELWCWGANHYGQLGDGSRLASNLPVPVTGMGNVAMVGAGSHNTCSVLTTGEVWCWGVYRWDVSEGGYSETAAIAPVRISGIASVTAVGAGDNHSCAVSAAGEVWCWGYNPYGQMGSGDNEDSATPVLVSDLINAVTVAAGSDHSCAVLTTGGVWCWGYNGYGQLGDGGEYDANTPVQVDDLINAVAVAAGDSHNCAVTTTGEVWCWGANWSGQLGDGSNNESAVPVRVSGVDNAVSVTAGGSHNCAVLATGEARCWGDNGSGQLGTGRLFWSAVPVPVLPFASSGQE